MVMLCVIVADCKSNTAAAEVGITSTWKCEGTGMVLQESLSMGMEM